MKLSITEQVISNFEQQLELQATLQAETLRLRNCILKRQLDEISSITHRIDEIAEKMEIVELERREMIEDAGMGQEAARSFDTLYRLLPEQSRDRMTKIRQKLRDASKENYRLNANNRILLEEALQSVKSTVSILTRSERASTGYDVFGKSSSVNRKKLLNRIG